MNSKIDLYVTQDLAFAGWCALELSLAGRRRRDLFSTPTEAGFHFTEAWPQLEAFVVERGCALYLAHTSDGDVIRVASKSADDLPRRMSQVLGMNIVRIEPVTSFKPAAEVHQPVAPAPESVPRWPSVERAEHFRNRGEVDPVYGRGGR